MNYREQLEQMYQLRNLVETPASSYKETSYLNDSPIYQNTESVNSERKETCSIYSSSQSGYAGAMSFISRTTNNQGIVVVLCSLK